MAVAPGERTTAGLGCSPGCGPTVRVADPEVADPAHPQRGMPRVRHKRGVFFRPSLFCCISSMEGGLCSNLFELASGNKVRGRRGLFHVQ